MSDNTTTIDIRINYPYILRFSGAFLAPCGSRYGAVQWML